MKRIEAPASLAVSRLEAIVGRSLPDARDVIEAALEVLEAT